MSEEYSITAWPDTPKIYEKLDNLINNPMRPIEREAMANFLNYFEEKCVKSKEMIERAKKVIPGGVQHNLAFNFPFPIAIKKAEGAYMEDIDGNKYIDFLQAGGPTILGSNYKPVREKVVQIIQECGPVTGLFHEYEFKLAEIINHFMPSVEMFRMLVSGTESAMAALRIASSEAVICLLMRTSTSRRAASNVGASGGITSPAIRARRLCRRRGH